MTLQKNYQNIRWAAGSHRTQNMTRSQQPAASIIISNVPQTGRHAHCMLYYNITSGTPEICQLPAGMADKNKLVLYPLY